MSYITPDTTVGLLKGCPIDKDYNHTLYFTSEGSQYTYFRSLRKHTLNSYTYQRYGNNSIRVQLSVNDVIDCNYMYFRNVAFGEKVFYAFIDSVEYVNNNTCTINYTIDVMQTWYFDYELGECFVEREHTETDEIGDNYITEDIATGDLVSVDESPYYLMTLELEPCIVIAGNFKNLENIEEFTPYLYNKKLYNGVPNGYDFIIFRLSDETQYNAFVKLLEMYLDNPLFLNNTTKLFSIPYFLKPPSNDNYHFNEQLKNNITYFRPLDGTAPIERYTGTFGDYKPKNNKLYIYPYNSLLFTDNRGNQEVLKYERFSNPNNINFKIESNFSINPCCMCYPINYNNKENYTEAKLIVNTFPVGSWEVDKTLNWVVNNTLNLIGSVSSIALGIPKEQKTSQLSMFDESNIYNENNNLSNLTSITNIMGGLTNVGLLCNTVNGCSTNGLLNSNYETSTFSVVRQRITGKYAKIIDEYFTMFGYAVKSVKQPNIRQGKIRPHFNYIKTRGCIIHSAQGKGLPSEDEKLITQIYDNGITFWTNGSEVGDYSLDNSPR